MNSTKAPGEMLTSIPPPVHLMGIGGAGVSSLAEYLAGTGMKITGCDAMPSARLDGLRNAGIRTCVGHDPSHITPELNSVIHSAAIPRSHPELASARALGKKVIPRSLALTRLSRMRNAICVAGSHGKSTVSAMISHILTSAGHDPGFIIGAVSRETRTGGYYGSGAFAVLETDEFDKTLELVCPSIGVITNVESEHLDVYGTMRRLFASFMRFARRAAARTGVVLWTEEPGGITHFNIRGRTLKCGFDTGNDCHGKIIKNENNTIHAVISICNSQFDSIMPLAGTHTLMNAILSAGAAHLAGISIEEIARSFGHFAGLERRFEHLGGCENIEFYTDYAHHPTEIRAVLETARHLKRPILVVLQPHLYSRTALMFKEFAASLSRADEIIVTGIYPAREKPLPGITGKLITDSLNSSGKHARYAETGVALEEILHSTMKPPVTVLFLSAGDLDAFARRFVHQIHDSASSASPKQDISDH